MPSVFDGLTRDILADDAKLLALFRRASDPADPHRLRLDGGELTMIDVFAAAERALELGSNPVALFVFIVAHGRWDLISCHQEDRGNRRMKMALGRWSPPVSDRRDIPIAVLLKERVRELCNPTLDR